MSIPYSALAHWYDDLNGEIDYEAWADALARQLPAGGTVLDLACGTGNITLPLARRGFDMIGTDISCDMLARAREKAEEQGLSPLLLCQDMTALDLYGTADGAVCCLDSINYLTADGALRSCFSGVNKFLVPDAYFFFDVNTPYKFENVYGDNHYVLEDDGVLLTWRNAYGDGLCDFALDVFTALPDGTYERQSEDQTERCYDMRTLVRTAEECGFEVCGVYGDLYTRQACDNDERWYFKLRKKI